MTEDDIEHKVNTWARKQGIRHLKLNLTGNTGWPDRVYLHWGLMVLIEYKGEDKPCEGERNQPARIEELVERGFHVGIFNTVDSACAFLAATLLSERWRKARGVTGMPGAVVRSGDGQDDDVLRHR